MMHGGYPIKKGRDPRQDKIDAENAMRNAGAVGGIEGIRVDGALHAGDLVKAGRDPNRGNVVPYKEMAAGGFGQRDDDYHSLNAAAPATSNANETSGSQRLGYSFTSNPDGFDDQEVAGRIEKLRKYGQGFFGLNKREDVFNA